MSDTTATNFSAEEEAKANKSLMLLSGILMIVFLAMGFLRVESVLTHYLWFAFALCSFAGVFVFGLVARKAAESQA